MEEKTQRKYRVDEFLLEGVKTISEYHKRRKELAEHLGISERYLNKIITWPAAQKHVKFDHLQRIQAFFKLPKVEDLFISPTPSNDLQPQAAGS